MLGPPGKYIHELFNPQLVPETSALGKRLIADVNALEGHAEVMARSRRYMGLLGNTEQFHIELVGTNFDDEALERLVNEFGDRIWGLDLRHTKVTDRGLRHLAKASARFSSRLATTILDSSRLSRDRSARLPTPG